MYFSQPGLTYSACGPITKKEKTIQNIQHNLKRYKKLKGQETLNEFIKKIIR